MTPTLLRLADVLLLGATALGATAQTNPFPAKPMRLVVPFAAGGPIDVLARAWARAWRPPPARP